MVYRITERPIIAGRLGRGDSYLVVAKTIREAADSCEHACFEIALVGSGMDTKIYPADVGPRPATEGGGSALYWRIDGRLCKVL